MTLYHTFHDNFVENCIFLCFKPHYECIPGTGPFYSKTSWAISPYIHNALYCSILRMEISSLKGYFHFIQTSRKHGSYIEQLFQTALHI